MFLQACVLFMEHYMQIAVDSDHDNYSRGNVGRRLRHRNLMDAMMFEYLRDGEDDEEVEPEGGGGAEVVSGDGLGVPD